MMHEKLAQVRAFFPHLKEDIIYLNHAAVSPLSSPVRHAMQAYIEERAVTNIENYRDLLDAMNDTIYCISSAINAPSANVEFTPNTSYGLNVLTRGLSWNKGDRVIIPSCEFPANVNPFLELRSLGVEVDFVPHKEGTFELADIEKLITRRTRVLTLSWVQFLSGFRAPLEEIGALCRRHGVIFCVDAIQGAGAIQLDVQKAGIDFLSCGGHKWLLATQGIGFIYVSNRLFDVLTPMIGWLNGPVDWGKSHGLQNRVAC